MTPSTYHRGVQVLHWVGVLLILGLWIAGFTMVRLPEGATQTLLFRGHIILGILTLLVTLVRIGWRFATKTPDLPEGLTGVQAWLFKGTHFALYIVLLGLFFSGVGMLVLSGAAANPAAMTPSMFADVLPAQGHQLFGFLLVLLFIAHVAGVMLHQFTHGDVMTRIGIKGFPAKKAG